MADETCNSKLAGAFAQKCGYKPKQGVNRKWYVNYDDIDHEASQTANKGTKITLLVLVADAKLYRAGGNKKTSSVEHAFAVGDFANGYTHTDRFTILYDGENERERAQELAEGARVVTISEKIDGGVAGEIKYEVAGYESGMEMTEDTKNSNENSGVRQIACATSEGEEEATGLKIFLLAGGVAATKTFIETNEVVVEEEEEV